MRWNFRWPCFSGSTVYWNFTMHDENLKLLCHFLWEAKTQVFSRQNAAYFIVVGSGSKLDFHIGPYLSELLLFQGQGHKIRTKWYSFFEAKKVRPFLSEISNRLWATDGRWCWNTVSTIEAIWDMALKLCWFFLKFCHGTLFLQKNDMGDVMCLNNRG